jgi:hypothetical protein
VFERKMFRKMFGRTKEDNGIWKIKTNKELDELTKHRNIIHYVTAQRLSWFGHRNRMALQRKYTNGNHSQEDQWEGSRPGGKMMSGMI